MEKENRIKSAALYPWRQFLRLHQIYLDKTVPHVRLRWLVAAIVASIFSLRAFYLPGFCLVAFCLGIYVSDRLIIFMTAFVHEDVGPPCLPVTIGSDDFKPINWGITEFQLWYSLTKAYTIATMLTFFPIFHLPVHPDFVAFWLISALGIMLLRIGQMIKLRYGPFTTRKMVYSRKNCSGGESLAC